MDIRTVYNYAYSAKSEIVYIIYNIYENILYMTTF